MTQNNFRITGRVIERHSNQSILDIYIEVWDKDLFFDDLVGSAHSGSHGRFRVTFNEQHFMELIERRPDIYFKFFQGDQLVPSDQITLDVTLPDGQRRNGQCDQIFWQLAPGDTTVGVTLNQPIQEVTYSVRGRVMEPDGSSIHSVTVQAFDIGLQGEVLLEETETDDKGEYLITYQAAIFLDQGKSTPDLDQPGQRWQGLYRAVGFSTPRGSTATHFVGHQYCYSEAGSAGLCDS